MNFLRRKAGYAWIIFLAALAVRLAYSLYLPESKISYDSLDWMSIAVRIMNGEGAGNTQRAPGYFFLLAGIFSVFGKSVTAVRVIQSLLGAAACALVYFTGRRVFSDRAGRIASVLACFYPYFIAYTGDVLSETLLTFLLVLTTLQLLRAAEKPSYRQAALTGVLMGITALTKSVVLPFFLLAGLWLWWRTRKFALPAAAGLAAALVIMPWSMRNYFSYDKAYVMPVTTPWYQFYCSYSDVAHLNETMGDKLKTPGAPQIEQFLPPDSDYMLSLDIPQRDKLCKETAFAWIRNNPGGTLRLLYLRGLHFWRLYPMIAYKWEKLAAMLTSGVYLPLAFAGILLSLRGFRTTSLFIALFLSYTAVHVVFSTGVRYRTPIDALLMIFTAYTLGLIWDKVKELPARLKANSR